MKQKRLRKQALKYWKTLRNQQMWLSQKLLVKKIHLRIFAQLLVNGLVLFCSPFLKKTNN